MLNELGLKDTISAHIPNGGIARIECNDNMCHLALVDTSRKTTYLDDPGLEEICQQFVNRLKYKLGQDDYSKCMQAASGAGTTPLVGAAWAYGIVNSVDFGNIEYEILGSV